MFKIVKILITFLILSVIITSLVFFILLWKYSPELPSYSKILKYKPVKNFNRLGLLKNQIVLADDFDEWPEDIAVKFGIKD